MKRYFLLSLCLIGFFGIFLVSPLSHAASNTIKIGIADSYTGPAAIFGLDMRDGLRMGINEINAKGGVLGKKIEIVTRDEQFKPDLALAMAKELIMKENVDLLMGTISSASALAISDLAKREKIPFLVHLREERENNRCAGTSLCLQHGRQYRHGRTSRRRSYREERLYKVLDRRR